MYSQLGSQFVFWGLLLQSLSERQEFNLDNHAQSLIALHANSFQINVISSLTKQRNTTQLFIPLSALIFYTIGGSACAPCCLYSNIRQCHLLGRRIARNVTVGFVFVSLGPLYYFLCVLGKALVCRAFDTRKS